MKLFKRTPKMVRVRCPWCQQPYRVNTAVKITLVRCVKCARNFGPHDWWVQK